MEVHEACGYVLRIEEVRLRQERVKGSQDSQYRHLRLPLLSQYVKADITFLGADIRVPDLCGESHQRRVSRVVVRYSDVDIENTAIIAGSQWSRNLPFPMIEIIVNHTGRQKLLMQMPYHSSDLLKAVVLSLKSLSPPVEFCRLCFVIWTDYTIV